METMIAVLSVNVDGTFTVLSTCPISPTEQLLGLLDDFILLGDNRTSENDGNVSIKHWTLHYEILLETLPEVCDPTPSSYLIKTILIEL